MAVRDCSGDTKPELMIVVPTKSRSTYAGRAIVVDGQNPKILDVTELTYFDNITWQNFGVVDGSNNGDSDRLLLGDATGLHAKPIVGQTVLWSTSVLESIRLNPTIDPRPPGTSDIVVSDSGYLCEGRIVGMAMVLDASNGERTCFVTGDDCEIAIRCSADQVVDYDLDGVGDMVIAGTDPHSGVATLVVYSVVKRRMLTRYLMPLVALPVTLHISEVLASGHPCVLVGSRLTGSTGSIDLVSPTDGSTRHLTEWDSIPGHLGFARVGDLNGDRLRDLAVQRGGGITAVLVPSGTSFWSVPRVNVGECRFDFDGDAIGDVVGTVVDELHSSASQCQASPQVVVLSGASGVEILKYQLPQ
jgi:hypothetical protein